MSNVKSVVDDKIASKKVMLFTKSTCGYSIKAKQLFDDHFKKMSDEDYEVWDIDNDKDCESIQNHLNKLTGARTVPRIFINKKSIGGFTDVQKKDLNELLKPFKK